MTYRMAIGKRTCCICPSAPPLAPFAPTLRPRAWLSTASPFGRFVSPICRNARGTSLPPDRWEAAGLVGEQAAMEAAGEAAMEAVVEAAGEFAALCVATRL